MNKGQKIRSILNIEITNFGEWPLIGIAVYAVISYFFACARALEILSPVVALFQITPIYAVELLVTSIGVTYGLSLIVEKKHRVRMENDGIKRAFCFFALFFAFAFLLECTLFQYNHYSSLFNKTQTISTRDSTDNWTTLRFGKISLGGDGFLSEDFYFSLADVVDGKIEDRERVDYIENTLEMPVNAIDNEYEESLAEFQKQEEENGLESVYPQFVSYDADLAVVSFRNLDANVTSIHIKPFFLPESNQITGKKTQHMDVMVLYTDEDNTNRKTNGFTIVEGQPYTEYIPLYPVGNVSELNICFGSRGAAFTEITLNEMIPLTPVLLRMLLVAGVLFSIWMLKHHDLFAAAFDPASRRQNLGFALMLALLFGYCAFMAFTTVKFDYEPGSAGQYNHYLIDALMAGRVDLDLPTSEEYAALERSYDRGLFELYGIDYLGEKVHWDTVYYQGKWYSYYGIVPAVLLFLPYTLLTGQYLPYSVACLIMGYLAILFLLFIWRGFFKRRLPNASYAVYLLSSLALAMCSFVPFLLHRSFFYETVNLGGLMFCSAGLLLLLRYREGKRVIALAASCLCFALAVGCRPIMLLSSALVPLFLWTEIRQRWTGNKGGFFCWALAVAVPYIVVAIPLMWYNYARFGSPFDFGSTYQVTGLNIEVQSLMNPIGRLQRFLAGIHGYFLNPPWFQTEFPFLKVQQLPVTNSAYIPQYLGALGLLCIPLSWLIIGAIRSDKRLRMEQPLIGRFIIAAFAISLLTAGLSATYCIQPRYEIDYAWLIMLSGLFSLYYLYNRPSIQGGSAKRIDHWISAICLISAVMFFFLNFRGEVPVKTAWRPMTLDAYLKRAFSLFGGI